MDNARCPFEKVILGTHGNCQKSTRFSMAQQMGVACVSDIARNNCLIFLGLMRDRARFALKVTSTAGDLPFGKEMKVMVGGLLGLQRLLIAKGEHDVNKVEDIHALVAQAQAVYGGLESLPYPEIMQSIAAFKTKRRGSLPP